MRGMLRAGPTRSAPGLTKPWVGNWLLRSLVVVPTQRCLSGLNSTASSPRGKPEIVGSNLDTLVNIGLDEKLPPDYRLAQQVCHAIANISDRRKARGVVMSKLGRVGTPCPPSTLTRVVFPARNSLLWVNVTLPSGCPRSTACLSDCVRWSRKVSCRAEPGAEGLLCLWWQLPPLPVQAASTQTRSGSRSRRWLWPSSTSWLRAPR